MKKKPLQPGPSIGNIEEKMVKIADLRKQNAANSAEITVLQDEIVEGLDGLGIKKHTTNVGGHLYSASLQQNTSRSVDEKRLKRKVGMSIWGQITSRVLDRKKLDAAVANGVVDPVDLADCITETPSKKFVKVEIK